MHLVVTWNYFHIFWCPVATNIKWHIVGDKRSEDREIDYEEVKKLIPQDTPNLSIWQEYGLVIIIGALILYGFIFG